MELDEKIYMEELFDLYSSLLTEYQREIFSLYYLEDLSLFEIAENKKVSRNAIFKIIKRVNKTLKDYEDRLKLHSKYQEIKEKMRNNEEIMDILMR